jgi:hypothetical protein
MGDRRHPSLQRSHLEPIRETDWNNAAWKSIANDRLVCADTTHKPSAYGKLGYLAVILKFEVLWCFAAIRSADYRCVLEQRANRLRRLLLEDQLHRLS